MPRDDQPGRAQAIARGDLVASNPEASNPEANNPGAGVSVVMVSFWTGPVLSAAIESVLAPDQVGVIELVLVDNGNPPEVAAQLERRAAADPRLILVGGHGNVGVARGCNIGARRARGRYLLLLNPDCRLAPGTIPALLAEHEALGDHWMLGCRVLDPDASDQRGSRRALLTPWTALVEVFRLDRLAPMLLRRYRLNHHQGPLPERTVRVPVVSGACMMLPVATFPGGGRHGRGVFPPRGRPRPLPSAAPKGHRRVLRPARGGGPPCRQQPGEPDSDRVAQERAASCATSGSTMVACAGFR